MDDNLEIKFRNVPRADDADTVRRIMKSSGFFEEAPDEIDRAVGNLLHAMELPPESEDYLFLFAEADGQTAGFACYGRIPCTVGSYYIYWLAVDNSLRGDGTGKKLIAKIEEDIAARGGRKIFLQTAGREQYIPTHKFYEKRGYELEAVLKDYYVPGDPCFFYSKSL